MSKGLIFFCLACGILLFTTINLSIGVAISGKANGWGILNCARYKDEYDKEKDKGTSGDELKYGKEWDLNSCKRRKGMHDMEYTAFIFDRVIGFVCGLLGLLHYFGLKKDFINKTGLIGLGCGIVGFILSFVYVIFNGLVFTTYDTGILKRDGDGVYAERTGNPADGKFKCIYFDKVHNTHAVYATYADWIKKQYNYEKDKYKSVDSTCIQEYNYECQTTGTFTGPSNCEYIYASAITTITHKDIADRFLTTLILSLLVCLANIGLAIFGFLLFKTPEDSFTIKFETTKI